MPVISTSFLNLLPFFFLGSATSDTLSAAASAPAAAFSAAYAAPSAIFSAATAAPAAIAGPALSRASAMYGAAFAFASAITGPALSRASARAGPAFSRAVATAASSWGLTCSTYPLTVSPAWSRIDLFFRRPMRLPLVVSLAHSIMSLATEPGSGHRAGGLPTVRGSDGTTAPRTSVVYPPNVRGSHGGPAGHLEDQPGRHHDQPVPEPRPPDGRQLRRARPGHQGVRRGQRQDRPVLRRVDLPPRHRGLHAPGRLPDRHRHRRTGLHVQGRAAPRAHLRQALPARDGQRRTGHQRLAVLHHRGADDVAELQAHDLRRGGGPGLARRRRRHRHHPDRPRRQAEGPGRHRDRRDRRRLTDRTPRDD